MLTALLCVCGCIHVHDVSVCEAEREGARVEREREKRRKTHRSNGRAGMERAGGESESASKYREICLA